MNGPKTKGDNRHYHTHYLPVVNVETKDIVDKDAALVQDHSTERASFQGRFRKTAFGDFKNRSGHKPEHTGAMAANDFVDEAKKVLVDAATESGVIIETDPVAMQDIDLHRLNDDGGPIHE
jgi:hypothetical protein